MRTTTCDVCNRDTENVGATMAVKRGVVTDPLGPMEKYICHFQGRIVDMPRANMTDIDVCPDCHKRMQDALADCVAKIREGLK